MARVFHHVCRLPASSVFAQMVASKPFHMLLGLSKWPLSASFSSSSLSPGIYTHGRWLLNDEMQRQARSVTFDFDNLCSKVLEQISGAKRIATYGKKEDKYNHVFIFTMDNGEKVVARIPTSVAGPERLITNSEVATNAFLKRKTDIPIPQVLDWSDISSNSVGCEYIIMQHPQGVELREVWFDLDISVKLACTGSIALQVRQMAQLEFPAYGSIYFCNSDVLRASDQVVIDDTFCVGPSCERLYWDCSVGESRYFETSAPDLGPWPTLTTFVNGLIDNGLSRLFHQDSNSIKRPIQGSTEEHSQLLRTTQKVLEAISEAPSIRENSEPTLLHPDLHPSNIFVNPANPTEITSITDWQSASIEPAFATLQPSRNCADSPSQLLSSEDRSGLEQLVAMPDKWDVALDFSHYMVPRLSPLKSLEQDLLRPFHSCHRTWKDGIVVLTQDLISLANRWEDLGLAGTCPYTPPAGDALQEFERKVEFFLTARNLKEGLDALLGIEDGWVPIERWEETQELYKQAYRDFQDGFRESGSGTCVEELEALWPYDIPS